jgi:sulfur relay (sulfurtransferase) DsrC/TusE family protein
MEYENFKNLENGFLLDTNGWNEGLACKFASVEVTEELT